MKILVINCGSSTLKFEVFEIRDIPQFERTASGLVDRIGERASIEIKSQIL